MNLKNETLEILHNNGKSPEDVRWVRCKDFSIPVPLFWELANQEYDSGYGAQVADDLIVVGDGFWLQRHEYDGSLSGGNSMRDHLCQEEVRCVKTIS